MILAFDLATNTGVAFGPPGTAPTLRSYRLGAGKLQGERFLGAFLMARRLIKETDPECVVIEKVLAAGGGGAASRAEILIGIRACVHAAAFYEERPVIEYAVNTVRKHFCGSAKFNRADAKRATIARCRQLGWEPKNDNEADAAALWDLACQVLKQASTHTPGGLFDEARP